MSSIMAKKKKLPKARSAYQAHMSTFLTAEEQVNIVDLSERKLVRLAMRDADANVRKLAARMLQDYVSGKIAVAWEEGNLPIYCFLKL